MKSEEYIKILEPVFDRFREKIVFAYLFGSTVAEEYYTPGDIDLAFYLSYKDCNNFFDEKLALFADISKILSRNDVDIVIVNSTKNIMLLDEIIRKGSVIYDSDPDLRLDYECKILHRSIDFKSQRYSILGI